MFEGTGDGISDCQDGNDAAGHQIGRLQLQHEVQLCDRRLGAVFNANDVADVKVGVREEMEVDEASVGSGRCVVQEGLCRADRRTSSAELCYKISNTRNSC